MAAGKCVNCHDPHGWRDAGGEIPHLLFAREEALCLGCHDGSPARTNIRLDAQKAFRHPMTDYTDRHTGPLEATPFDFATTPINRRHAECEDCHNPHLAQADRPAPPAPELSATNRGVSRLLVQNGPAGAQPSFTFIPGSDTLTTPTAEYQLCFNSHSSWTTQPSGQTDLARVLNPANASYHPVQAGGRDLNIRPDAFEMGWSATSMTACGDCHGSDSGLARGPHGSSYRYILSRPYTASPARRVMSQNEICFACHAWDVYANPNSPETVRAASRFNKPRADKGHAEHVGEEDVSCYSCHTTHGSADQPHLLVLGRVPGIVSFAQTASGGSCRASCHGSENYQVNYAR
jgi:predicted CXXCH cytochrome family protein